MPAASINDIHKNKPAASVNYSKRMPEIEALMQEWPPEMEAFLKTMHMPSGDVVGSALWAVRRGRYAGLLWRASGHSARSVPGHAGQRHPSE